MFVCAVFWGYLRWEGGPGRQAGALEEPLLIPRRCLRKRHSASVIPSVTSGWNRLGDVTGQDWFQRAQIGPWLVGTGQVGSLVSADCLEGSTRLKIDEVEFARFSSKTTC